MLINEIGVADEQVVDIESRRVDVDIDPKARETLAMALEAALAHVALSPSEDADARPQSSSEVTGIGPDHPAPTHTSRTDAA